ncbi:MAG: YhbY family RNA-binding protein [candidate division KSB1 bacterium]|nr:YhbY family RNA-binding protein [candidate division KSB1 bacterium]
MELLTSSQRGKLRGLAHSINPVAVIGKNGLSTEVLDAIDHSLNDHELIKIRFLEFKDQKKDLVAEITQKLRCHLVDLIGHVAILYRQHPEEDKRKVNLPTK